MTAADLTSNRSAGQITRRASFAILKASFHDITRIVGAQTASTRRVHHPKGLVLTLKQEGVRVTYSVFPFTHKGPVPSLWTSLRQQRPDSPTRFLDAVFTMSIPLRADFGAQTMVNDFFRLHRQWEEQEATLRTRSQ